MRKLLLVLVLSLLANFARAEQITVITVPIIVQPNPLDIILPGTGNSLVTVDGTWSFANTSLYGFGNEVLLNGQVTGYEATALILVNGSIIYEWLTNSSNPPMYVCSLYGLAYNYGPNCPVGVTFNNVVITAAADQQKK
jgi:hypothetical protein